MMQNQRVTSVTRNEMVFRLDRADDNSKPLENVGERVRHRLRTSGNRNSAGAIGVSLSGQDCEHNLLFA
jgi:hypothetical protein